MDKELLLKFIQQYKDNVVSINVLNTDEDYYYVECKIDTIDLYSPDSSIVTYDMNCKVDVTEFNKFKRKEQAVIWE